MASKVGRLVFAAVVAAMFLGVSITAQAQQPRQSAQVKKAPRVKEPPLPERDTFIILARTVLIAVHHGNLTGNYSVLRELGSPTFQEKNSTATLSSRFAGFRRARINLSPVALYVPRLTVPPKYVSRGVIVLTGLFPTKPKQIRFDLFFQVVRGAWRLHELRLSIL